MVEEQRVGVNGITTLPAESVRNIEQTSCTTEHHINRSKNVCCVQLCSFS